MGTTRRWAPVTLAAIPLAASLGCGGGGGGGDGAPEAARALLAAIPEHGDPPGVQAETTYVGRVAGTQALLAIVDDGASAAAYVCDGAGLSEWFLGTSRGATLRLEGEKGGAIEAVVAGASVSGAVATAGAEHAFDLSPAVELESGIYRTVEEEDGERITSGWIFFDGEWRGADEDSGKGVVGAVSAGGIDDATGSGTGLGSSPPPVPQEVDCDGLWCEHESQRCFISFMAEARQSLKGKKLAQANAMIKNAQKRLNEIGNDLTEHECVGISACPGTGYDSSQDTPNCG